MSAVRTRILLGDDADLLARVKTTISGRPDLDVVNAGSMDEVVQAFKDTPPPRAAILPATGALDGITLCRQLKAARPEVTVVLVLPADKTSLRDACLVAGADDVVFAPADADELTRALGDAGGFLFEKSPRAEVPLRVHLQAATGKVLEVEARQISRSGMRVALPAGMQTPPGTLLRAVFTLYQDGTLTVWVKTTAAAAPPELVLRFVALTADERKSIDYFVGFYTKVSGASEGPFKAAGWQEEPTREQKSEPSPPAGGTEPAASTDSLADVFSIDLATLASVAGNVARGKSDVEIPAGFSGNRLRSNVTRLTPVESAAIRGTTVYADLAGELRSAAAMKLKLLEVAAQLKGGAPAVPKKIAEDTVLTLISEAQQLHGRIESVLQAKVLAADTAAVRELTPVKASLVHASVELKNTLDRDVLGKAVAAASAPSPTAGPVRYDRPASDKPEAPAPAKPKSASPAGPGRKIALAAFLVVGAAGAIASNIGRFGHAGPPEFNVDQPEITVGSLRVVHSIKHGDGLVIFIVDDSWKHLSDAERASALTELASRTAAVGGTRYSVVAPTGKELHSAELAGVVATPTGP